METVDSDTVFGGAVCVRGCSYSWDQSDEEESGVCATLAQPWLAAILIANLSLAGAKSHLGWRRRRFGGYTPTPLLMTAQDDPSPLADASADAYADVSPSAAV